MTTQAILEVLEKIVTLHSKLHKLAQKKTTILMDHSMNELADLLALENQYIQVLEQYEAKRQTLVNEWFLAKGSQVAEQSLTNMIDLMTLPSEKKNLQAIVIKLTKKITKLKQQEQLNADLLRQAMAFNQVMLEMIHPTIDDINYGKKAEQETKQSVFDSEA